MPRLRLVPFDSGEHLPGLVDLLERLSRSDQNYPPQRGYAAVSATNADWFLQGAEDAHIVAVFDGQPVGSVRLGVPRPYLDPFAVRHPDSQITEMKGLVVDPDNHGRGTGTALLAAARKQAIESGHHLMLAVIHTSASAIRMYRREDLLEVGQFIGANGLVLVFEEPGRTYP